MIELILGGARSGKSTLAEQQAVAAGLAVSYVATAERTQSLADPEMAARIAHHAARRPAGWELLECPLHLAATLRQHAAAERCLIVDCLTLWLANLMFHGQSGEEADLNRLHTETEALLACLPDLPGHIILVSNELGMGVVPLGAGNRRYVDEAGRLNQRVAALAERVTFVAAGLPLRLKG